MTKHTYRRYEAGFTAAELLAATVVCAIFFTAAALVYQTVTANQRRLTSLVEVEIGAAANNNYYGVAEDFIVVYSTPNFGRLAMSEELREIFWEDVGRSTGVYCLSRNVMNTARPVEITYPTSGTLPSLDTAESFRALLEATVPGAGGTFLETRNVPTGQNASIFITSAGTDNDKLVVGAIYEIDLLPTTNPVGTYVSVRRYVGYELTHYYDVFYEPGDGTTAFAPIFVNFERRSRLGYVEGDAIDRFKVGAGKPFTLLWWPDPTSPYLESTPLGSAPDASDPREAYYQMAGRTAYFFAFPQFPAL